MFASKVEITFVCPSTKNRASAIYPSIEGGCYGHFGEDDGHCFCDPAHVEAKCSECKLTHWIDLY